MNENEKIQKFDIGGLHNTGDCAFLDRICNATTLLTESTDQEMIAVLKKAVADFTEVVRLSQILSSTDNLVAIDELVDSAWRGLHGQVKVMLRHPSAEVSAIANETMAILDKYGDITNQSYNDEYGAMLSLINDLNALGAEKLQKIYLTDWVAELDLRRTEFNETQAIRENEKTQVEVGETKAKRTAVDRAYRDFVELVNAKALVLGVAPYEAFIKRANVIIDEAKLELTQRAAKTKTENTNSPAAE